MRVGTKTLRVLAALAVLSTLFSTEWAATLSGAAAHSSLQNSRAQKSEPISRDPFGTRADAARAATPLPAPVRFRESDGLGLLVRTWVNGAGPYTFAIDTGAGANILSRRVASEARVEVDARGGSVNVGGLSGAGVRAAQRAYVRGFAAGTRANTLPAQGFTVISDGLPADIDGVLDPSEVFGTLGYVIDFPAETLSAFDPRTSPLRASDVPEGGAVVRWLTEPGSQRPFVMLTEGGGRRPFVMLGEGRRALLDTGSGFGLALTDDAARAFGFVPAGGRDREAAHDIAGGHIPARRVRPATVHVGPLVLQNVPTDFLPRAESGAPVLLGRDALRPFRLTFDPVNRLIQFRPL